MKQYVVEFRVTKLEINENGITTKVEKLCEISGELDDAKQKAIEISLTTLAIK